MQATPALSLQDGWAEQQPNTKITVQYSYFNIQIEY